jgi:hypothetical protein
MSWVLRRLDKGAEGVEFEIHDDSNQTLVCSRITNRREADLISQAPKLLIALKAVKSALELSQDKNVKRFIAELAELILKAS